MTMPIVALADIGSAIKDIWERYQRYLGTLSKISGDDIKDIWVARKR
jgi:hypothetical protein